ncbi:DNA polymerase III subunit gamma/tau [Motiliproteus sp. MSK22-1]|uniref:DNA polymerase III subunit gamma/tau n=1 Tax=Motiliproteus sp. MSK22-1 TaxID=1897630 RepID=UPI000975C1DC|nr:DNA polymerase III subunit gamma/tau [Motiliproteus sp. MSK22-1]OMH36229.1 hypothetical protein BGP75_09755 [Motiliproteus sp. MSK22-1]
MSYQVLARKWRPSTFDQMVGQDHVLKALVNALNGGRLHHAYLFTGTRGVGKTSIARLFAKSLNCENGVSASPCGECSPCREIKEGRFVDLIEVDAASRTKVEDTRELLENVQYAPTQGRFKVYLIDEVHMLSTHSFNALLKTLEEPPPHIKFLLATTDPQKLPVTILSRCLQFNLKNMSPERVVDHLKHILNAEQIDFEDPALWLLSRAANGSMRDALSLTDQAISFGSGQLLEEDVRAMLGSVDQQQVLKLLAVLAEGSAAKVMDAVASMAEFGADFSDVLAELLGLLHRVALAQILPDSIDNSLGDQEAVLSLARSIRAEDVQLFYQIALCGRKDLPLVPVPRDGFEMTLLRMLAFRPVSSGEVALPKPGSPDTADGPPDINNLDRMSSPSSSADHSEGAFFDSNSVDTSAIAVGTGQNSTQNSAELTPEPDRQQKPSRPLQEAVPGSLEASVTIPQVSALQESATVGRSDNSAPVIEDTGSQYEDKALASTTEFVPNDPVAVAPDSGASHSEGIPDLDEAPPWGDSAVSSVSLDNPQAVISPQQTANQEHPTGLQPTTVSPPVKKIDTPEGSIVGTSGEQEQEELNISLSELNGENWIRLLAVIGLSGMTYNIAANAAVDGVEALAAGDPVDNDGIVRFLLPGRQMHLYNDTHQQRIEASLSSYFNGNVRVVFNEGDSASETPAQHKERRRKERLAGAIAAIQEDPNVQAMIERFGAVVDVNSVEPINP